MLRRRERKRPELFVAGSLRELLPGDHVLVRVDRVLDLGRLRAEPASFQEKRERPPPRFRRGRWHPRRRWANGCVSRLAVAIHTEINKS